MVKLTIDNLPVEVPKGTTILNAAKSVGVFLPTLCYMKDVNDIGACRICVAEVEGRKKLVTTCNTPVDEGMVVWTNSPRARQARRVNVQLLSCPSMTATVPPVSAAPTAACRRSPTIWVSLQSPTASRFRRKSGT